MNSRRTLKQYITGLALAVIFPMYAHAEIIITEIMYNLPGADTGREWVEITNLGGSSIDASRYKFFEANVNHVLTVINGNGVLQPGDSAIITNDSAKFKIDWSSYAGTLFDSSFSLSNTGESFALKDGTLVTLNSVSYNSSLGAAGDGTTLQWKGSIFAPAVPTPGTYRKIENTSDTRSSSNITSTPASSVSAQGDVVVATKPFVPVAGSKKKTVKYSQGYNKAPPIISAKANIQKHEETVHAPAAAKELAAVGATLPSLVTDTRASGLFSSPWILGLLGIIVVASAVFILF